MTRSSTCFLLTAALLFVVFAGGCHAVSSSLGSADGFDPLWNGETLEGWEQIGGGAWHIEDGVLVGTNQRSEEEHGILMTQDRYRDFTVRLQFKALQGNSGLYFRVAPVSHPVMVEGMQAEIEAETETDKELNIGGLYETLGRGWVKQTQPEEIAPFYRPGEWNEMTVRAEGDDVTVYVNGRETAALTDDEGRREGHIGLQIHGSQDVDVRFRNIEIKGAPVASKDGS